jgi:hypothetical protein
LQRKLYRRRLVNARPALPAIAQGKVESISRETPNGLREIAGKPAGRMVRRYPGFPSPGEPALPPRQYSQSCRARAGSRLWSLGVGAASGGRKESISFVIDGVIGSVQPASARIPLRSQPTFPSRKVNSQTSFSAPSTRPPRPHQHRCRQPRHPVWPEARLLLEGLPLISSPTTPRGRRPG